jgi:hypothetical protein
VKAGPLSSHGFELKKRQALGYTESRKTEASLRGVQSLRHAMAPGIRSKKQSASFLS